MLDREWDSADKVKNMTDEIAERNVYRKTSYLSLNNQKEKLPMETNESKMVRFAEDDIILKEGSTEKILYKIIHGKAMVYLNYGQENELLVGLLSEQRCFGEYTILCGKPSVYTVVAYSDILLLRITEEDFDDFIRNNSANAIDIMRNLANTLATLSLNINLVLEELKQGQNIEPTIYKDITEKVRFCTALDSQNQHHFNSSV